MSAIYKSRVWETATVTGTGAVTLSSTVVTGYQSFASAFSTGATVPYVISDTVTGAWEVGVGTYTTGSLARGVTESSNAGALVNFAGNTCNIFVDVISPVVASAGAANSGAPVALDPTGLVDPSVVPGQVSVGTTAPTNTKLLWLDSTNLVLKAYNGTSWIPAVPLTYDIAVGVPGTLTASQVVAKYVLPRSVTLPAGFTGAYFVAGTAPTAAATLTVAVNGTSIGTVNFAAAATTATFTAASATTITAGQVLTVTGPATADTTLADVSGTLVGTYV